MVKSMFVCEDAHVFMCTYVETCIFICTYMHMLLTVPCACSKFDSESVNLSGEDSAMKGLTAIV